MEESKIVTISSIIQYLKDHIEQRIPISASLWLDAAIKLNVLLVDVDDEYIEAKMAVAEEKARLISEGNTVASSKALVEATDAYRKLLETEMRRERVTEFIRIAKKRTELQSWDQ